MRPCRTSQQQGRRNVLTPGGELGRAMPWYRSGVLCNSQTSRRPVGDDGDFHIIPRSWRVLDRPPGETLPTWTRRGNACGRPWGAGIRRLRTRPLSTTRELKYGSGGRAFQSVLSSPTSTGEPAGGRRNPVPSTVDAALLIRRASGSPGPCSPTSRTRASWTPSRSPQPLRKFWQPNCCPHGRTLSPRVARLH